MTHLCLTEAFLPRLDRQTPCLPTLEGHRVGEEPGGEGTISEANLKEEAVFSFSSQMMYSNTALG